MKYLTKTYIAVLAVASLTLPGCADDLLYDSPNDSGSGDYISFSAGVSTEVARASRSADEPYEPYEPLVLDNDESSFPVYLHTYEHAIGSELIDQTPQLSRGEQVDDVDDFVGISTSFAVDALKSDGSVYINQQNTRQISTENNRLWISDGLYRWPGDERLSFHAIAPNGHETKLENPVYKDQKIEFSYSAQKSATNDKDAESQPDLMMAVASMTLDGTVDYDYHVPLKFNHALSAIKFAVRDVLAGEVISIAIQGVKGSGKCVYTAGYNSEGGAFEWNTEGVEANSTFTQLFNHKVEEKFPINGNINDEQYDVVLTYKMPEKTFMMIPQVIPDEARIELVIKRDNPAPGADETITVRGKIKANDVTEWKPGYEYVYTISTSKDNWVYVFEATGNEAETDKNIFVYSPGNVNFSGDPDNNIVGLGNNAYFDVVSYRYRANNHNYIENLPWTASHEGSYSYEVTNEFEEVNDDKRYPEGDPDLKKVTAAKWITDNSAKQLKGDGSTTKERHNLSFLPHYVTTDWNGDKTMQGYPPYTGFNKDKPYDLSTFGGKRSRTTANCYVVDRGGWYMLPLVYGNAIKNDAPNTSAYTSGSNLEPTVTRYNANGGISNTGQYAYKRDGGVLKTLVDYKDQPITQSYIKDVNDNCRAMLLWQDAYNMIDNVELVRISGEYMLRFRVNRDDLQQGNAVVALLDRDGIVMWSWHIWATEHWLNPSSGLPHVYENDSWFTAFKENGVTHMRERGDVAVTYNQGDKGPFYMSPYNLGWCDPKRVMYLKRQADMKFVQYQKDGSTVTGKTVELPVIQDGVTIDYKYANTTYYQWGRKDAMRGYFDLSSNFKVIFGERLSYTAQQGNISIGRAIQNPEAFYGQKGSPDNTAQTDWLKDEGYLNLWNNHSGISGERVYSSSVLPKDQKYNSFWVHTKTVYDPSPAGYMIPNAGVFHVVNKSNATSWYGGTSRLTDFEDNFNGMRINDNTYKIWGDGIADNSNSNAVYFYSTGNRWWEGATNQANTISFAWSNRSCTGNTTFPKDTEVYTGAKGANGRWPREAFGLALGLEGEEKVNGIPTGYLLYRISAQFLGRRAMGRPVRAIREP